MRACHMRACHMRACDMRACHTRACHVQGSVSVSAWKGVALQQAMYTCSGMTFDLINPNKFE